MTTEPSNEVPDADARPTGCGSGNRRNWNATGFDAPSPYDVIHTIQRKTPRRWAKELRSDTPSEKRTRTAGKILTRSRRSTGSEGVTGLAYRGHGGRHHPGNGYGGGLNGRATIRA
jgi:hypothetical protein